MDETSDKKTCLILLGMGGPNRVEDVKEFLYNIFSDRAIIQLPGGRLMQKPFAKLISQLRHKKVMANYQLIGGGSPLLRWTKDQKDNLEFILSPTIPGLKCFIGMRYFKPTIKEAIDKAYEKGFREFYFLPLYPQYCKATTGSSFSEVEEIMKQYPESNYNLIKDYHDFPGYVDLMKEYINDNIKDDELLLFSAHSIPQKFVDEGDPYVEQVKKTAELSAGDREYLISFQSRTGPVKWVGPDTVDETKRLTSENKKLFIVPISFICDHIETLFEIDIELKHFVGDKSHLINRMPMFNDSKKFGSVLAEIVLEQMDKNGK